MTHAHEPKVPKLDVVLPRSADGSSFDIYKAASAAQVQISLPDGARPEDFFIDAANYMLPHAFLTTARSCAQNILCVPGQGGPDAPPNMQVYLYIEGDTEALCEGQPAQLGTGDIVIYDSRRGYEAKAAAFEVRIVTVPHDRVPPIFLSPRVHGLRLPAEEAGTRLLATAIESLMREVEDLSVVEADHAVLALCQLAAGVIEAQLARLGQGRRGAETQLAAAMGYIDQRCGEPDLGPDAVCAYLGVSRSSLYRLFASLGGIEAAIRRRRLDHSMRALLTKAPALSPSKLALSQGFRSEAQFARAFRGRFGTTPSQVHAKVAAGDQAWLAEQAGRAGFDTLQAWLAALAPSFGGAGDGPHLTGHGARTQRAAAGSARLHLRDA